MSLAFSAFNLANKVANPANTISAVLGFAQDVDVQPPANIAIPQNAVPPELDAQFQYIIDRWQEVAEADRRVLIDAFVQAIMRPLAVAPGQVAGAPVSNLLRVGAEQWVGADANRVGHGPLDYLVARSLGDGNGLALRPSVIIEAKRALGGNNDFGQWQLAAQMATAKQIAGGNRRYTRGVLTDGYHWRFYQLNTSTQLQAPLLERSPAYDATVGGGQRAEVIRLLWKFIDSTGDAASIWL